MRRDSLRQLGGFQHQPSMRWKPMRKLRGESKKVRNMLPKNAVETVRNAILDEVESS